MLRVAEIIQPMLRMPKGASTTKDAEKRGKVRERPIKDCAQLLRAIAALVGKARLSTGARVLDASDFRLIELGEKTEKAETLEQFLSQT
jgi:hypothetical protein